MTMILVALMLVSFEALACDAGCGMHHDQFEFQELVIQIARVGKIENRFVYPTYSKKKNLTEAQLHQMVGAGGAFFAANPMEIQRKRAPISFCDLV